MSDEAQVTTDATAPVVTEAPVTTPEAPNTEGLNAYQLKRAMKSHVRELVASSTPAETPAEPERPRDPATGQFISPEPKAPETPPAENAAPAATEPQKVRIKLPDMLATRYGAEREVPAELEELFRFAVNNHVRAKEVEDTRSQIAELRAQLARAEAAKAGWQKQTQSALANPDVAAKVAQIREVWGDEEAQRYLRGVQAELQSAVDTDLKQVDEQLSQDQLVQNARTFQRNAVSAAQERYPQWFVASPHFDEVLTRAMRQYGTDLEVRHEMGESVKYDVAELWEYADTLFQRHPKVRETAAQQVTAKRAAEQRRIQEEADARAKSEAAKAEAQRLEEAARRHSSRPPAVSSIANTGQVIPAGDNLKKQSPSQQKKTLRNWAKSLAQ